ncbi:hypothetical protein M1M07_22950 [Rhodococcus sp. HM1]|uniref:hypothetical protein n=1 Tax=Rhodococcus sp. HM1 TaxID=2937759 RepID=UPI00200B4A4B|nr:hypothetical protein [Rhodococcus sp. HM1]MCK8673954.1 hypothetical protein [Rhodococcus sp. HM1]
MMPLDDRVNLVPGRCGIVVDDAATGDVGAEVELTGELGAVGASAALRCAFPEEAEHRGRRLFAVDFHRTAPIVSVGLLIFGA